MLYCCLICVKLVSNPTFSVTTNWMQWLVLQNLATRGQQTWFDWYWWLPEVESSRTSLASRTSSRTHFEVLGLGLEASSPRKLACPRLKDSTSFWNVKILWSAWKIFWKTIFSGDHLKNFWEDLFFFFFWDRLKNFCEDLFFYFFWRALALVSLVLGLGLEHSCPWPRECLSSERLSLALASDFFCVLGLEPCVLDSTSALFGLGFFLCPWLWPRALCPRLHFWWLQYML